MPKRFHARVHWAPVPNGGLRQLPSTRRYVDLSRFAEDGPSWPAPSAWSVVLEFDSPPAEQGNPSDAIVSFLVNDAPEERLHPGRTFELRRGPYLIGEVEVADAADGDLDRAV